LYSYNLALKGGFAESHSKKKKKKQPSEIDQKKVGMAAPATYRFASSLAISFNLDRLNAFGAPF
jgi:hypothetical protein